jgi:hypothetical protein
MIRVIIRRTKGMIILFILCLRLMPPVVAPGRSLKGRADIGVRRRVPAQNMRLN